MEEFRGKGLCGTMVYGVLVYLNREWELEVTAIAADDVSAVSFGAVRPYETQDPIAEVQRFRRALDAADREYDSLYRQCLETIGEKEAEVFRAQAMILTDIGFADAVAERVLREKINAELVVWQVGNALAEELEKAEDAYIAERAQDVRQVRDKVLQLLAEEKVQSDSKSKIMSVEFPKEPFIVVADDLTPEEVMKLPKEYLRGIILQKGNQYSHTAVLVKAFGLTAVMQMEDEMHLKWEGFPAILDGREGLVYLEPDKETIDRLNEKQKEMEKEHEKLQALKGMENITPDGRKIDIYANASSVEDVKEAFQNDAGGIGLLRSEFLYLGREMAPDEETQLRCYKEILELAGEKEVIIRTFDFGADKMPAYLQIEREENPALGLRGIRLGFRFPELLKVQLRALYRAGVYGNLSIMYPMISEPAQVDKLKKVEREVKQELSEEGKAFRGDVPVGIMIETPSAALLSEELARKVDFFSLGTNDLTQYTYAKDRLSAYETVQNSDKEAVMRLIELSAKNAKEAGIPVGICGEMALDAGLTRQFLAMGIDELSVPPKEILRLREHVRRLSVCS